MYERSEISTLTNEELTKELRKLSMIVGPVTSTTRKIYENRLFLYWQKVKEEKEDPPQKVHDVQDISTNKCTSSAVEITKEYLTNNAEITKKCSTNNVEITNECSTNNIEITKECSTNNAEITKECSTNNVEITKKCSANNAEITKECSTNNIEITKKCSANNVEITKECSTNNVEITKDFTVNDVDVIKDRTTNSDKVEGTNHSIECPKTTHLGDRENNNLSEIKEDHFGTSITTTKTTTNETNNRCNTTQDDSLLDNKQYPGSDKQNEPKIDNTTDSCTSIGSVDELRDGSFYGVWVPYSPSRLVSKNKPNICYSQKSALKEIKKYNGARFKQFKNEKEASDFSLTIPQSPLSVDNVIEMLSDRKSFSELQIAALKAPTIQEVQKFRVYLEKNDIESVKQCLINPKYLINTKDIPVILHEGSRLNAMHVAVKSNRLNFCQLIMDTLNTTEVYRLIYPNIDDDDLEYRKNHLIQLYLNSPEKIMCDTPLHLACKYGFTEIVRFLLSFPTLKSSAVNKDGKMPLNMLCARASVRGSEKQELIKELSALFEEKVYIPLYHCAETIARVGEPIHTVSSNASSVFCKEMRACVGPLSPSKGQLFYHIWRRSPRDKKYLGIARSDFEKGMERIGRSLAMEEKLPYFEYWDFLNGFTNLSTSDGLEKLDRYLQLKSQQRRRASLSECEKSRRHPHILKSSEEVDGGKRAVRVFLTEENDSCTKRRLHFGNESTVPVVIDISKLSVEFDATCKIDNDDTEHRVLSPVKGELGLYNNNTDNNFKTPMDFDTPETKEPPPVYIHGNRPSKQDIDVLRAIEMLGCDLDNYPNIDAWRRRLEQTSKQDRESWPSPGTPRYKGFLSLEEC